MILESAKIALTKGHTSELTETGLVSDDVTWLERNVR